MSKTRDWADLVMETRARLGLTQEQFASKIGVTFTSVNRWENRRVKPSRLALRQIEEVLCDMDQRGDDLRRDFFGPTK